MKNYLNPTTVALGIGLLIAGGCASSHKIAFESAPATTAAQTNLKVRTVSNGNSEIKLKVKHLTPPDKVKSGSTAYVVWAQPTDPAGSPMMNLGAVKPNKDLRAEFESITPYRNFKLLLTPESDVATPTPTADPVLWTQEIKNKG